MCQPPPTVGDGDTFHVLERNRRNAMSDSDVTPVDNFALLDDTALLSRRAEMRDEMDRLPAGSPELADLMARYDRSTAEVDDRARRAWTRTN
jgi:hypothetical protein